MSCTRQPFEIQNVNYSLYIGLLNIFADQEMFANDRKYYKYCRISRF